MIKHCTFFVFALLLSFASFGAGVIIGSPNICVGGPYHFEGDTTILPVTWSSSNPSVATVVASTPSWGAGVTGISPGTATITYSSAATTLTMVVTVSPFPTAITGTTSICVGGFSTLSSTPAGGTWTALSGGVSITPSGVIMGISPGLVSIYYYTSPTCFTDVFVTVNGPSIAPIVGYPSVCVGSAITLTNATPGGTWTSSAPSVATISAGGVVTGIGSGTAIISYAVSGSCTGYRYDTITVSPVLTTGTITGTLTTVTGANTTLTSSGSGVWTSSNPSVATINFAGVVTGIAPGTTTISYTVAGCSGPLYTSAVVTVNPSNCISGHVNFSFPYSGSVKIWLITFNPATLMLQAVDSQIVASSGTTAFYQFTGVATDSFRVKAATTTYSSFAPTYYDYDYYWGYANVIYHVSGTADVNKDINMIAGTAMTGPGFIGGSVTAGANKGSSGSVPVVGLNMYLIEAATGNMIQFTKTDATGSYSFSGIAMNTYLIFPDSLNYVPTPYTGLTLTTAYPSKAGINFTQHTISKTITPTGTGVNDTRIINANITIYPNPTAGEINIRCESSTTEEAELTVSDIIGRIVYATSFMLNKGISTEQIELPVLTNGLYIVQIKSDNTSYNRKLQIQH